MPDNCRSYLDTVVTVAHAGGNGMAGAGFWCRAAHWHSSARHLLFLVASAHVIRSGPGPFRVIFQRRTGDNTLAGTVTGKIGPGPRSWFVNQEHDLAALLVDPERLPAELVRYRWFDLETDVLTLRQMRRRRIGAGSEGLVVGFAEPVSEYARREYPAVRLATLSVVPGRPQRRWPMLGEGTGMPGDSGSPLVVRPGRDSGGPEPDGGKLIGVLDGGGREAVPVRVDEDGAPTEIREKPGLLRFVPADGLRDLIHDAVAKTILAETFGPLAQRVRGWVTRGRRAESLRAGRRMERKASNR